MAIALMKIMQRSYTLITISRQYKRRRKSKDDIGTEESSNQDINNELSDDSYAVEDVDNKYEGFAFLHDDMVCSTQDKAGIPKSWILLDSQSTVDVFSYPGLLTNI